MYSPFVIIIIEINEINKKRYLLIFFNLFQKLRLRENLTRLFIKHIFVTESNQDYFWFQYENN